MVTKPQSDTREYSSLVLPNKFQAMLITDDSDNSMAACSLTVGVGTLSDFDEFPGLAHFLEHMCFMGSEKYPEENSFAQFITQNGGYTNAETGYEYTTYMFEVDAECVQEALDRFAQFFIAPLFAKQSSEREIQSIDSEFKLVQQDDDSRLEQLISATINAPHPIGKFGWGNLASLNKPIDETIAAMRQFFNRYYSADIMTMCVYAPGYTIRSLTEFVTQSFSAVPNRNIARPADNLGMPDITNRNILYWSVPVKDIRTVTVTWIVPPLWDKYATRPDAYIEALLGHESKGSILYALKARGLATGLSVGNIWHNTRSWFSISIAIKLSEKGLSEIKSVLTIVFTYIHMMHSQPIASHFYSDLQTVYHQQFNFFDKIESMDYCVKISESLQNFSFEKVLTAGIYGLIEQLDESNVRDLISYLTPERARIDLRSFTPDENCHLEPWFGTKYKAVELPANLLNFELISSELYFPSLNEFISTNFDILSQPSTTPSKIYDSKLIEAYHNIDTSFGVCKANAYIGLLVPNFRSTVERSVTADLLAMIIENDINDEFGYQAREAGYGIAIQALDSGFEIQISGFSDKLPNLVEKIMTHIYSFNPDPNTVSLIAEKLAYKYKNANLEPRVQARNMRLVFLQHYQYLDQHKYETLLRIADSELEFNIAEIKLLMFYSGNITRQDVMNLCEYMEGLLHAAEAKRVHDLYPRTVTLLKEEVLEWSQATLDPENVNSVLEVYYQFGQATLEERALVALLVQALDEEAFNTLRTEQQLGYHVEVATRLTRGICGLSSKICSSEYPCDTLFTRWSEFLESSVKSIKKEFKIHKKSLITSKKEPYHNLSELADVYWDEIFQEYYEYDRKQKEVKYLQSLTYQDFTTWLQDRNAFGKALVVKVCSHKWGVPEDKYTQEFLTRPDEFRNQFPCYSRLRLFH
jgi:nardilysin